MGRLSQVLKQIRGQFAKLGVSQRLLLLSLGVILVMAMLLVALYAGKPSMVELMPSGGNQALLTSLRGVGIEAQEKDGKIVVPAGAQTAALAHLGQTGQLPSDTRLLFSNILEAQSWQNSREQNRQVFRIALQNELGRVISEYRGIRDAKVLIDAAEPTGLGAVYRQPTAAVTVFSDSGAALDQNMVDAIGHQVAGAVANLDVGNVRVIDGVTGRQRRPRREGDMIATTTLELAARYEDLTHQKLSGLLEYIPGVIIAVTAQVDASKRTGQEQHYYSPDEGGTTSVVTQETVTDQTSRTGGQGPQPGPRSNATADISQSSGGGGPTSTTSESNTTTTPFVGSRTEQYTDPRGLATGVAVSINVPEGFVLGLLKAAATDPTAEPAQADIDAKWADLSARIRASVLPHVRTLTTQTMGRVPTEAEVADFVQVSLIPGDGVGLIAPAASGGLAGLLAGGSGGGGALGSIGGLIDKAVLAVLAIFAIGLMLTLVKKASKEVEIPTAEELVGVPPTLETPSDLIGEADESDLAMAGIEVGEEQVKSRRMLEEVSKMVETNPDGAARLMKQWISSEG